MPNKAKSKRPVGRPPAKPRILEIDNGIKVAEPPDPNPFIWGEIDVLIEQHPELDLTFGLEYSSHLRDGRPGWSADLTPRAGHPLAGEYGCVWTVDAASRMEALRAVIDIASRAIEQHAETGKWQRPG